MHDQSVANQCGATGSKSLPTASPVIGGSHGCQPRSIGRIALGLHPTYDHCVFAPLTKAGGAAAGDVVMRCRAPIALTLAAGLYAPPSYAQTQDEQALALLRASSAQSAIITFCGKHFAIDGTTALRISQTTRDVATKVLGPERANAVFKDELARRYAEVNEVGEQQWCADQRVELSSAEVPIFKD